MLIAVQALGDYHLMGTTLDDAVGEAFDKTAKLLGLGYPGGPALAALAGDGDESAFAFPRPMLNRPGNDFSFSGLKTAVMLEVRKAGEEGNAQFRRSLYVIADVKAGDLITPDNLKSIRPGYGLAPRHYDELLGRRFVRDIERATPMSWDLCERKDAGSS